MNGQTLLRELRSKLERTIQEAREVSESAARAALEQLGVGEAAPFKHLSAEERDLRVKLRAHGRQLGDRRNQDKGTQEIELLSEEVAYQHWHRMLFALFLAENDLLMYPDPENPVAVTLKECDELAVEDPEVRNGWELAARYATRILPQIFRLNSPVFKLNLPLEYQQKLERLLEELPTDVFLASDSLGWVYQYWQSRRKEEVNKSGVKIGERELPAVTQLFTEPYMVNFLLDNALGAWWAARKLSEEDLKDAESEEELREKASLSGVPLEYLRFVKDESGLWTPAAGAFDEWPEDLSKFKVMDPCCGSGHFLVAAFHMLAPIRMELESLKPDQAVDAVLKENLYGLEIDQRCVEIAAFALALNAWRYPGAGGYRELPELNIACSGLSVSTNKEDWISLGGNKNNLCLALGELYEQFRNAPIIGSLITLDDCLNRETIFELKWDEVEPLLSEALAGEINLEKTEMEVVAKGIAKAAELLSFKYDLIITNVPYLGRGKQNQVLMKYCESRYPESKSDLATVFLERCINFLRNNASISVVLPQNWLFLSSYVKFREKLLERYRWDMVTRLGEGGFESDAAAGAFTVLVQISKNKDIFNNKVSAIDVSCENNSVNKANILKQTEISSVKQKSIQKNPNARITLIELDHSTEYLSKWSASYQGLVTGDIFRFSIKFWEIRSLYKSDWVPLRGSISNTKIFGGMEDILLWQNGKGELHSYAKMTRDKLHDMHESGNLAWGKKGVAINRMRNLRCSLYLGEHFHNNLAVIIPFEEKKLLPLYVYCESGKFEKEIRKIDQKLSLTNLTILQVPFNLEYWQKIATEKYPHGLPKPFTDDPTQWIFHCHPCGSVIFNEQTGLLEHGPLRIDSTVLQVAVARLLGYRWPAELDQEIELSDESRYWVNKCEELLSFVDQEGIVCITPVRGEAAAADRIIDLLAAAYGEDWNKEVLSKLLEQSDHAGKTLETWLRDKFFIQHCKLFHHRPFIWQIWDGLPDGFSALVNYHKLDRKNLETLTYTYLGDWIKRQKQDQLSGVDGAVEKLAAAENLQKKLELILEGGSPYDIFVRWKPLEQQPIGWEPDLNDGVRMNIRPFMSVPPVRKKGAGVLRDKPNIKWTKDRGKDVPSAPWYNLFKGERINDHHLSLKEKKEARRAKHNYDMVAEDAHGE